MKAEWEALVINGQLFNKGGRLEPLITKRPAHDAEPSLHLPRNRY
jgi:hypothetical protein